MSTARKRSRASAKQAGAKFERLIADYLAKRWDDRIDRKVRTGSKDTGDIANFRTTDDKRITVECKNERGTRLTPWWNEVTTEQANAGDELRYRVMTRGNNQLAVYYVRPDGTGEGLGYVQLTAPYTGHRRTTAAGRLLAEAFDKIIAELIETDLRARVHGFTKAVA